MFERTHRLTLILALLAAALLAGCSDDETSTTEAALTGSDDYQALDFSLTDGGLTASDEDVAFGDENLKALLALEEQEVVQDPLAELPEVAALEELGAEAYAEELDERPRFTFLRLRWGRIHGPEETDLTLETPCPILDWTGEVHVDRGLIVVRRMIAFEYPLDQVIFPRPDPRLVAFTSHTACHYDGLVLQIIERPEDYAADLAPNRFTVNTGPYQGEYLVSELAGLAEMIDVDEQGNRFQLTGFTLEDIAYCPKGFLSGSYLHLPLTEEPEDDALSTATGVQLGVFMGPWVTLDGRIRGFLRGGYGFDAEGRPLLIGKYIDRTGRFQGFVRGQWTPGEVEADLAEFAARWVSASGTVHGVLGGRGYPVTVYPGGFYVGRWTTLCDDQAEAVVQ